jgi:hypothetical protein
MMKKSFFCIAALVLGLMMLFVPSSCGLVTSDPRPIELSSVAFRILNRSHHNILGKTSGYINPDDIKIVRQDGKKADAGSSYDYVHGGLTPYEEKLVGDGSCISFSYNEFYDSPPKRNEPYEHILYFDLPGGDRDTLVLKHAKTGYPISVTYNGIAGFGYGSATYLIKDIN